MDTFKLRIEWCDSWTLECVRGDKHWSSHQKSGKTSSPDGFLSSGQKASHSSFPLQLCSMPVLTNITYIQRSKPAFSDSWRKKWRFCITLHIAPSQIYLWQTCHDKKRFFSFSIFLTSIFFFSGLLCVSSTIFMSLANNIFSTIYLLRVWRRRRRRRKGVSAPNLCLVTPSSATTIPLSV